MKIPKLFNKDSEQPKKGDEPQLDLASLQPDRAQPRAKDAFDSILAPRGHNAAAPAQSQTPVPPEQPAPSADSDPMGKLALGGLRPNPAEPSQSPTPVPPGTPVRPEQPQAAPEPTQSQPAPSSQPPADAETSPSPAPQPADAPQSADPLAALSADAPEPEPAPESAGQNTSGGDANPAPGGDALAGLAGVAGADAEGEGGDDLLDIFRDAKEESEEGSLVKELDDVPIGDLFTDIVALSQQLGVTPGERTQPVAPPPDDGKEDAEPAAPTVRSVDAKQSGIDAPEPEPADPPPPTPAASQPAAAADAAPTGAPPPASEPAPLEQQQPPVQNAAPSQPVPQQQPSQTQSPAPPQQQQATESQQPPVPAASESPVRPDRQQMLHVLVIGLSLALIAGIVGGSRGADLLAANPAGGDPDATPTVLAYINEPIAVADSGPTGGAVPQPAIVPTPVPAVADADSGHTGATPTPSPSPTPTPAPTPGPDVVYDFDPMAPAYYNYTVESGDSLTSMSREFGICPDHILWNNPPRTEYTPLYVGEQLIMPGIPGVVHIADPGDSIASLAARYSVSQAAIIAFPGNHLQPGDTLRPGQRVLMPHGIPPEALLQNADAYQKTHVPSADGLVWPYAGPVTTYFGEVRPNYIHYAIDIGGLGSYGQPVVSVAAGKVVSVGYDDPAYGNHVTVDHGDGRRTHYAHFQDVYVAQGQTVQQSQPLGSIGCTGASTGTHLHFELSQNGQLIDPLPLLP